MRQNLPAAKTIPELTPQTPLQGQEEKARRERGNGNGKEEIRGRGWRRRRMGIADPLFLKVALPMTVRRCCRSAWSAGSPAPVALRCRLLHYLQLVTAPSRSLSLSGPRIWNELPEDVVLAVNLPTST